MTKNKRKKKTIHNEVPLKRVVTTSFLANISDVLLNLFVATISGSVTMFAQAFEGAADFVASGLVLLGVNLSERPPDKKHPYGYGREIYFWTFVSGLVIFGVTATLSFYWGLERFLNPKPIDNIAFAYFSLIFSFFTNGYAFSLSYKRLLGKKNLLRFWETFMHSALIETKTTFVLDLMGTSAALFGLVSLIIYRVTGDMRLDGVGAMLTGLILAFFAIFILKGSKELLVGQSPSDSVVEKIKKITSSFEEVNGIEDLRVLLIGSGKLLVNMEVHVVDNLTTDEIEKLIDRIEKKISEGIDLKAHVQIELETPDM